MQAGILWRLSSIDLAEHGAAKALPRPEAAVVMAEQHRPSVPGRLEGYRATLAKCRETLDVGRWQRIFAARPPNTLRIQFAQPLPNVSRRNWRRRVHR